MELIYASCRKCWPYIIEHLVMQPLPTKLVLQKKKAKEGRSGDDVEHYPVPSKVTVRKRSTVAIGQPKESGGSSSNHV